MHCIPCIAPGVAGRVPMETVVTLKPKAESAEISILPISQGKVTFAIVGTTPLIFNRMAEKAKRTLLVGGGKKTAADKAANLKHNPVIEFRDSVTRNKGDECVTRLAIPSPAFKSAMATAALDMPGAKKTEIGRLTWVDGFQVDLYGIPQILLSVVRSADMARTPDIRSRAIVPAWACFVTVNFVQPKLNATVVANLMAAAGITAGVGDFRQEKGKGNYGQFRLADKGDKELAQIIKTGGRVAQDKALLDYKCYDDETEELLEFYSGEVVRLGRGKKEAA